MSLVSTILFVKLIVVLLSKMYYKVISNQNNICYLGSHHIQATDDHTHKIPPIHIENEKD